MTDKKLFLSIILLFCIQVMSAQVIIERSDDFDLKDLKQKKLIVLLPEVSFLTGEYEVEQNYLKSGELNAKYVSNIESAAKANGFNIDIKSVKNMKREELSYYPDFISLKQNIFQSNNIQEHPFNKTGYSNTWYEEKIVKKVFVEPPRILPEFSYLAEKYNTPYFAIISWISINTTNLQDNARRQNNFRYDSKYSILYFIIVNTEKSIIQYRELKMIPYELTNITLYPVLYDTFFYLKQLDYGKK
jgi:hypothetical protein